MNQAISYVVQRKWLTVDGGDKWIDITQPFGNQEQTKVMLLELRSTIPNIPYRLVKRITEDIPIQ